MNITDDEPDILDSDRPGITVAKNTDVKMPKKDIYKKRENKNRLKDLDISHPEQSSRLDMSNIELITGNRLLD